MKDYKIHVAIFMLLFALLIGAAVTIKLVYNIKDYSLFIGGLVSLIFGLHFMRKDSLPINP